MVLIPRDPADSEADSNVSRFAANSSYLIDPVPTVWMLAESPER